MESKYIKSILILTLAILIWSCECTVTDPHDPNALILPKSYANILYINAMPDRKMNELFVLPLSDLEEEYDTIYYKPKLSISDSLYRPDSYKILGTSFNNMKNTNIVQLIQHEFVKTDTGFQDSVKIFFNSVINIKENINYTCVFYGDLTEVQPIFVMDTIKKINSDDIWYRCFNASPDLSEVRIVINTEGYNKEFDINNGFASELQKPPSGPFDIYAIYGKDTVSSKGVQLYKGQINNIVLKGYESRIKENRLRLTVYSAPFPK